MPINSIDVYSSSPLVQTFPLSESSIEDDLFQILNIDGLDPVKASIGTSAIASVDGETITGKDVPSRNIVLTLRSNPNWNTWSYELLRAALYTYFTPKNTIRIIFYTDELPDVEISGVVESVEANPFSKDPQLMVSIICPDPYFTKVNGTVVTGVIIDPDAPPTPNIMIGGHVPIGFALRFPTGVFNFWDVIIQAGSLLTSTFELWSGGLDFPNENVFEMNTRPKQKFIRAVDTTSGSFQSILRMIVPGSTWPILTPGENRFIVRSGPMTGNPWELTYFEKYSGL